MAWNTLTYSCGHTEQVQLYGKTSERERTIDSAARHECVACRAAAARRDAAANGLPVLQGSEKQVAWAGTVRAEILSRVTAFATHLDTVEQQLPVRIAAMGDKATPEMAAKAESEIAAQRAAIAKLPTIAKAGWWIDHRGADLRTVVASIRAGA